MCRPSPGSAEREDQPGGHELRQRVLGRRAGRRATAATSGAENSRPIAAPICATSSTGAEPVQPRHQRGLQRGGIASGGNGPVDSS